MLGGLGATCTVPSRRGSADLMANVISFAETKAIQGFLSYLNKNYSKRISTTDTLLIAAVSAWFHQESGGLSRVIGNNPFNIRSSPLQSGQRTSKNGNGKFAVFSSMAVGFAAAAHLLMRGGWGTNIQDVDAYGYRLALNALKRGGNQGAVDFLAALAMSKWDAAHYGVNGWLQAYDPKQNHLIRNYVGITGVQLKDPHPKPPKPLPILPRDFNYQVVVRNYLDPWAVSALYKHRTRRQTIDVSGMKR
jgi:hypothetical protein